MYVPKHFRIDDENETCRFIEKYSFATLISQHNGEPYASHLPLILKKSEHALYGHFARPNDQWNIAVGQQVLAIFQGPHSYISPSWYETNKAVPTWNYVSVHVYGNLDIIENESEIFNTLNDLTVKYESPDSPYQLEHIDQDFIKGMSRGIVAFKIKIARIEAKAKLSQNHPVERQELIVKHLEQTAQHDGLQIASLMKKNLQK
jgi:transcriptional regulator